MNEESWHECDSCGGSGQGCGLVCCGLVCPPCDGEGGWYEESAEEGGEA